MGLSLSGISGASGILPPPTSGGSFNWALLPNVPTNRRTAIETACNSAASGQSFTANDVFALLTTANYWWSFEQGSIFTSIDTSVISNSTGDLIGAARDWIQNALITQSTSGARPVRASAGLTFDGSDDCLTASLSIANATGVAYHATLVATPLRSTTTKGGAFIKCGGGDVNTFGFGLGCGSGTFDTATSPNQIALHENVAWVASTTAVAASPHIHTFSRASGTTRLFLGNTQTVSSTTSVLGSLLTISLGGYTASGGGNRFINCNVQCLISHNNWSTTNQNILSRFLNSYYALGLTF